MEDIYFTLLLIFFGVFFSYLDIKYRKIKNHYFYSFMFFVLAWFFFFKFNLLTYEMLISLIVVFLVSLILHYKKIWGAADGKIFIVLSFILLFQNSYVSILDYIISLFIIYSLLTILQSLFFTSFKVKKEVFKSLPFGYFFFYTLMLLGFLSLLKGLRSDFLFISDLSFLTSILVVILVFSKLSKKYYSRIDENSKVVLGFIGFSYGLYQLFNLYVLSFVISYSIRSLITILTSLSLQIGKKKEYHAPFVLYLFLGFFFQFFIGKNILIVLMG